MRGCRRRPFLASAAIFLEEPHLGCLTGFVSVFPGPEAFGVRAVEGLFHRLAQDAGFNGDATFQTGKDAVGGGEDAACSILRRAALRPVQGDRKSVVLGKSVSVRVDLGGRRIIKKKKKK